MTSFVTCCPHCQTCFKVTEQQIAPYHGVVRCGVCADTFNASEHGVGLAPSSTLSAYEQTLIDEQSQPTEFTASSPALSVQPVPNEFDRGMADRQNEVANEIHIQSRSTELNTRIEPSPLTSSPLTSAPLTPAPAVVRVRPSPLGKSLTPPVSHTPSEDELDDEPLSFQEVQSSLNQSLQHHDIDLPSASDLELDPLFPQTEGEPLIPPVIKDPLGEETDFSPSRLEHLTAELNKPKISASVWFWGSVGMFVILLIQTLWLSRESVANTFTSVRPSLDAWCEFAGCSIVKPLDIKQLDLQQPSLMTQPITETTTPEEAVLRSKQFDLSFVIRNRSLEALPMPAFELSIKNELGNYVVKTVFLSNDYLPLQTDASTEILSNTERKIALPLHIDLPYVGDPSIRIFFP